jgi:hypothetical protein
MAGKINRFFREFVLAFSIILTIVGIVVVILGICGIWYQDIAKDVFGFSNDVFDWSLYILILGFIVLGFGVYYLYYYLKNRKFILEELETNKRSELLKRHGELKITVRKMPSKYQKMLKEKEDELKIR